jgi:hypothetical protein
MDQRFGIRLTSPAAVLVNLTQSTGITGSDGKL